jgi:hypothetical protein
MRNELTFKLSIIGSPVEMLADSTPPTCASLSNSALQKRPACAISGISMVRQRYVRRQHVRRIEARAHMHHRGEAAQHQARTRQQHQG